MKGDFTYTRDGPFYVIWPETEQARKTVSSMLSTYGFHKLLPLEFEVFCKQALASGYQVRKAKRTKCALTPEELFAELAGKEAGIQ